MDFSELLEAHEDERSIKRSISPVQTLIGHRYISVRKFSYKLGELIFSK
jgi:hypothetical protein